MLSAVVSGISEVLRCISCGSPGDVAATDIPVSLRKDGRSTVVYCRACAAHVVRTVRQCAEFVGDATTSSEARMFAGEIEDLLKEVPPCEPSG